MNITTTRLAILAGVMAVSMAAVPAMAADQGSTMSPKTSSNGITTVGKLVESQPVGDTDNGPQAMAKPAHEWPMPAQEAKQIQQALNKAGAKLPVNGNFDDATKSALRDFQTRHGLNATGLPDVATLDKLGIG